MKCFNMASDNTRKLMLAKVLNSARAANILDENDSDGVRGLIAEENCDIESSGGCADDSEDSISDDEGLADNSVSQIQTDIQDNMTEL